jgi:cytosine/adenosine deaminase-related metal-dependent hydrolase
VAETREELRLIEHRDGPLRDFLQSIGAWEPSWSPPGPDAIAYLEGPLTSLADWLIAHGNYFTPDDIQRLADRSRQGAGHRSVIFCPRTHAYFGHTRHPYSQMLAAGLTVCLGTDSLASTPSLSILDEMRFLHRRDPSMATATILHMATLSGAAALRRESVCGSLTVGKLPDLAVVRLPDRDEHDPHRLVLDSDLPVITTIVGGRVVFQLRGN